MSTLKTDIYGQLARTNLLSQEQSSEILAGNASSFGDIIVSLLTGCMDCEALTAGDPNSTWTEKRMARLCLILAFLAAIGAASKE